MLPLLMIFGQNREYALKLALSHLKLTHGGSAMVSGGTITSHIILDLLNGKTLEKSVAEHAPDHWGHKGSEPFESLKPFPDQMVVGRHFSSACYMDHSIPASLYLACKYSDDPEQALIANTMCGGDNAGRGSVLGAILGAANGLSCWPERWVKGLVQPPEVVIMNSIE